MYIYKGRGVQEIIRIESDVLPAFMHMLSMPHALPYVMGICMRLDPDRFNPEVNPGLRVFTFRDKLGCLKPVTTDVTSDWIRRKHPAKAPEDAKKTPKKTDGSAVEGAQAPEAAKKASKKTSKKTDGSPVEGLTYDGLTTRCFRYAWGNELVNEQPDD